MSAFSAAPQFEAFLKNAANAPALAPTAGEDPANTRFIPRNFLIDERIDPARAANYAGSLPAAGPVSFADWTAAHSQYIDERVFIKLPAGHDHQSIATDDPSVCPETFRAPLALRAFGDTDLDVHFIRMEAVDNLAWRSGKTENEIFALGEQVVADPRPSNPAHDALAMILEEAFQGPNCDHRPVFAAFYEDFQEELRDPAALDWPNQLRDRLGLYHISQWYAPFPRRVFLFRYAVRDIPRRKGDPGHRPIALPGVLDHRMAAAFCPAPRELSEGQLVNLQAGAPKEPCREVLHLSMPQQAQHLFRVGAVTTPVPSCLGPARRDHLVWLRLLSQREDYAAATDADLLQS